MDVGHLKRAVIATYQSSSLIGKLAMDGIANQHESTHLVALLISQAKKLFDGEASFARRPLPRLLSSFVDLFGGEPFAWPSMIAGSGTNCPGSGLTTKRLPSLGSLPNGGKTGNGGSLCW